MGTVKQAFSYFFTSVPLVFVAVNCRGCLKDLELWAVGSFMIVLVKSSVKAHDLHALAFSGQCTA